MIDILYIGSYYGILWYIIVYYGISTGIIYMYTIRLYYPKSGTTRFYSAEHGWLSVNSKYDRVTAFDTVQKIHDIFGSNGIISDRLLTDSGNVSYYIIDPWLKTTIDVLCNI